MATPKLGWKNLPPAHKAVSILSYVVYAGLALAAFKDIRRRSSDEVRGNRRLWMGSMFMVTGIYGFALPVGPIAYLLFGRKR